MIRRRIALLDRAAIGAEERARPAYAVPCREVGDAANDRPEVRQTFAAFHQLEVDTTYSISSAPIAARELILANFSIA